MEKRSTMPDQTPQNGFVLGRETVWRQFELDFTAISNGVMVNGSFTMQVGQLVKWSDELWKMMWLMIDIGSLMNHDSGLGYVVPNMDSPFVVALFMRSQVRTE